MHSLQHAVELDSSLHFFFLLETPHIAETQTQTQTQMKKSQLFLSGSLAVDGKPQNSELNSIVGSGRNLAQPFVSTTAALWANCGCYQVVLFRAPDFLLAS